MTSLELPSPKISDASKFDEAAEANVMSKVSRRLLGLLFILFCASYLDRINISFAALSMNKELGLSATAFGLANTFFYVGYVIFEIPSNLILERVGARRWIARIMVTWGIASTLTLFAIGPNSLYLIRCLVGIAEAGFLPGVLLYLTYWFPATYRARANSLLMIAMPITSALGSVASGLILQMNGVAGLAGWQWLFLIEGVPTIFLGFVALRYLTDSPDQATWLTETERACLKLMLASDAKPANAPKGWRARLAVIPWPPVIALSLTYFCLVLSLNASATWMPQIIRSIHPTGSMITIGLLSAIPALVTMGAMLLWSKRSDRFNERKLHTVLPMLAAALGCGLTGYVADPAIRMAGLVLTAAGAFTAMTIFWTVPAMRLTSQSRALGIGFVSSAGLLGSATSPLVFGWLRDLTHTFSSALAFTAVMLLVGVVIMLAVQVPNTPLKQS